MIALLELDAHRGIRPHMLSISCAPRACAPAQVQNLLQQMQGRFSTMSDAIIGRSTPSLFQQRAMIFEACAPRRPRARPS